MDLFIQLGSLEINVRSSHQPTVEILRELFGPKASFAPWGKAVQLLCDIIHDSAEYAQSSKALRFNGPSVDVSPGIYLTYDFAAPLTRIYVHNTAIIEFDRRRDDYCRVLIPTGSPALVPGSDFSITLPEAFFYPLVVEWIRRFGRCLIHCGAVELSGRTLMLTGPPGSGKSTHILRMLLRGGRFIADDLGLLRRDEGRLILEPFREVANVSIQSIDRFPELSELNTGKRRGDGKYSINIKQFFGQQALAGAPAGTVLRLHPDQRSWLRQTAACRYLDGMHNMAFFAGHKDENIPHFQMLTDWLWASAQWDVSQGYMAEHLDDLIAMLSADSNRNSASPARHAQAV